jgi:hypothetical protein
MGEAVLEKGVVLKLCLKCKTEKPIEAFGKNKNRKDGFYYYCKTCKSIDAALHYKNNREQITAANKKWGKAHKEQAAKISKRWYEDHKEQKVASHKKYYEAHKEQKKEYVKANKEQVAATKSKWFQVNKGKINLYYKERKLRDPNYKMACDIRSRVSRVVRGGHKAGSAVKDCGCSMDFLRQYLQSKFDPTMTWENYGKYGWHIDHITPLVAFNLANREQFLTACHYTNLQPLWWRDNLSKGSKEA